MSTVMRGSARATSAVAALLLVILSLGVAGAAYADPGTGNGNDGSNPGNAYGTDSGNGADNGQVNGADNGNGAQGDSTGALAAAASVSAPSAKSDTSASSSVKSSSSQGSSSTRGTGAGSTKSSSSGKVASDHKTNGTAATVGAPTLPQPNSGADDNPGGANGQCPGGVTNGVYCSTRNGSASGNGNGGGQAVGKPCAGCVGKADNKNPHGQMPGPQDHNNGYECDGNNGIAKTNPAHTGCKPGTPPCVGAGCNPPPPPVCVGAGCNPPPPPVCVGAGCNPPPVPPVCVGAGCNPPPPPTVVCPEGAVLVNGVCVFGGEELLCPDGSVMPPNGKCKEAQPPTLLGEEAFRPPVKVQAAQAGVLPATGSSSGLGLLAGLGFTLLAVGAGVMLRRRTV